MNNTFSLDTIEPGSRVAVAMSGGVDSSVVASLAHEAGFDVVGITLKLYDAPPLLPLEGGLPTFSNKKTKTCCAGQDIYDAREVADRMGFSHYVLDYESVFKEAVIDDFVDSYLEGDTPIPCVRCNQKVKFRDLLQTAKDLEAKALLTGHYVKRIDRTRERTRSELHRAVDLKKDQSYFLFSTTQSQLDYLRFPLGGWTKDLTRYHAERLNLSVAEKPDSQDICFVPNGSYAEVVKKMRPGALDPGEIVHVDGRVLGAHEGIIHYTVGQRRGLSIAFEYPLFVVSLNAEKRQVIVGPRTALAKKELFLKEVNWLNDMQDYTYIYDKSFECKVRLRSSGEFLDAHVLPMPDMRAHVTLKEAHLGIASGQACVFYEGTRVMGGGWITSH